MKRLALAAVTILATFAAACGGGSTTPPPPPPQGNFSNASLKGQYSFLMSGSDVNGSLIGRVGSFTADGVGNITSAIEDVNSTGALSFVQFAGGTYNILANGRGTLTFNTATGGLGLAVTLTSASQGLMSQIDLNATSSGNFIRQTPSAFTNAGITGNYVFDVSGIGSTNAPLSIIGQIKSNGNGNITGGTLDVNDGSSPAPSGPQAVSTATYSVDNNSNGTTFGRGSISINGVGFVFYLVDNTRIRLIEADGRGDTLGDAVPQSTAVPAQNSAFTGNFAFLIGGSAVLGTQGPIVRGARFTADGSGKLTAILLNDNNDGGLNSVTSASTLSNTTYSIDTAHAGSGRGTATFTDSHLGTFQYVFYLSSPSQGVIQDTSNGVIGDGSILAQSNPPIAVPASQNYAFSWSGINLGSANNLRFEEDFLGQYSAGSFGSNGFNGAMDFEELGTLGNKALFIDIPITVTFAASGDGTGSNPYTVVTGNSPSTTFHYQAYFVNPTTVFLVGWDQSRVIAGSVIGQQ